MTSQQSSTTGTSTAIHNSSALLAVYHENDDEELVDAVLATERWTCVLLGTDRPDDLRL